MMAVPEMEITVLLVATIVAFLVSGAYYTVLLRPGGDTTTGDAGAGPASPRVMVLELLRTLVLVTVVAVLADLVGVRSWGEGAIFGFALWVGFPLMLWMGAMLHEGTPWRVAALHGGDWLVKLVVVGVLLSI